MAKATRGFWAKAMLGAALAACALGAADRPATLAKIRELHAEKSWAMAVEQADGLAAQPGLTESERREAAFLKAESLNGLSRHGEAGALLADIAQTTAPADRWKLAALRLWTFGPNTPKTAKARIDALIDPGQASYNPFRWQGGRGDDFQGTAPMTRVREAARMVASAPPAERLGFAIEVVVSAIPQSLGVDQPARAELYGYLDTAAALAAPSADNDLMAALAYRRAEMCGYVDAKPGEQGRYQSERLAALRAVAKEFSPTRAAARARMNLGQVREATGPDLPGALVLYREILDRNPDTPEARDARERITQILKPELVFQTPATIDSGKPLSFILGARNVASAKAVLLPFDAVKELGTQAMPQIDLEKAWTKDAVASAKVSPPTRTDHLGSTVTVELAAPPAGTYILEVTAEGAKARSLVVAGDLTLVTNTGGAAGRIDLWAVDRATGKPRAGVKVQVGHTQDWSSNRNGRFTKSETVETDSDGLASVTAPGVFLAVARDATGVAIAGSQGYYNGGSTRADGFKAYAYTDRPAYRPGQTVYWRSVVRSETDGRLSNPGAAERFRVEIFDAKGASVLRRDDLATTAFGSLSGEIAVPEGAPLGAWRLAVSRMTNAGTSVEQIGTIPFRVEEYRKPEYEVTVAPTKGLAKIGEPLAATITARTYFGAPVADANVKFTVRRREHYTPWWISRPPIGCFGCDLSWFRPADDNGATGNRFHSGNGDIVATGEGRTDAAGKFETTFKADVPLGGDVRTGYFGYGRRGWWWGAPADPSWDFAIEATVIDKSRRSIDGAATVVAGKKALAWTVTPRARLFTPGDLVKVDVGSANLGGAPIGSSGTLHLLGVKWDAAKNDDTVTTLASLAVTTGTSGSQSLQWRVPSDFTGALGVSVIAPDPFGGSTETSTTVVVARNDTDDVFVRYQGIQVLTDRDRYVVGETARVMILNEFSRAWVWHFVDTGSGHLERRVIPLTKRTNFLNFPIVEGMSPNAKLHVVAVRDGQLLEDEVELVVPPTRKILNVTVTPRNAVEKPGARGAIDVTVTDRDGRPVAAEFSLSAFDRSITYIAPDTREDSRKFFYGARRGLVSRLTGSTETHDSYPELGMNGSTWINANWLVTAGGLTPNSRGQYAAFSDVYFSDRGQLSGRRRDMPMRQVALRSASKAKGEAFGMAGGAMALSAAAPAAPAAMAANEMSMDSLADAREEKSAGAKDMEVDGSTRPDAAATLRTDFRDSALWTASVVTGADGRATVAIPYPDSLTTWKLVAVAVDGTDCSVGESTGEAIVKKNLLVRVAAPRFALERDRVTLSAIVRNDLPTTKTAKLKFEVAGLLANGTGAEGMTIMVASLTGATTGVVERKNLVLPPGGETRVEAEFPVGRDGEARLRATVLTDEESDAVEIPLPLVRYGADKTVVWAGSNTDVSSAGMGLAVSRSGDEATVVRAIHLPRAADRSVASTRVTITLNPSMASALREAIPGLIEYPYGCVEQTTSRFLPAAAVAGVFRDLSIPQHPFIAAKLPDVTAKGVARLADFQRGDGSWGWWRDDEPNRYMTAYVTYALTLAKQAGVDVPGNVLSRGLDSVTRSFEGARAKRRGDRYRGYWRSSDENAAAFELLVLALNGRQPDRDAVTDLWERRTELSAHGLAMTARAMHRLKGRTEEAAIALRNLKNFAHDVPENQTAYWGRLTEAWYWWDDAVESTAMALQATLEIDPADPMARRAAAWLVLNRTGNRWKSTKDSAHAIIALAAYMKATGEGARDLKLDVMWQGAGAKSRVLKTVTLTKANFWNFDGRITLEGDAADTDDDGNATVTLVSRGTGQVYHTIRAEYFSREEKIAKAGFNATVERTYERLVRDAVVDTTAATVANDRYVLLPDGSTVRPGDEVRVTLRIKALNDFEYVLIEDPKPAGFEPVALVSGGTYAGGLCSNVELRDRHVAFFVTHLPKGQHTLTFNARAETPGLFHAMPTRLEAMYFPPLKANSDSMVLSVRDGAAR